MKIDAVVPTLNLDSCYRTIETLKGVVNNIIIVESGKGFSDEQVLDDVLVFQRKDQLSFGDACRIGVEQSDADRILLINDDAFATPGAVDYMKQSKAPIVGARLVYPDGRIQHGGGSFLPHGAPYHLFRGLPGEFEPAYKTYPCLWVTFAATLVDRALWDELEGFDPLYRNGFEDVDFCLRAREAGYLVEYVGLALFIHEESTTLNRLELSQENNWRNFQERWVTAGRLQKVFTAYKELALW